jgi:hypothetical protein
LALHLSSLGLLKNFNLRKVNSLLLGAEPDGEHWLLAYEAVRHGFNGALPSIASNPLFAELLKNKVTFLRRRLPSYALIVHQGGAPEWIVKGWVKALLASPNQSNAPAVDAFLKDIASLVAPGASPADAIIELLDAPNTPGAAASGAGGSVY